MMIKKNISSKYLFSISHKMRNIGSYVNKKSDSLQFDKCRNFTILWLLVIDKKKFCKKWII